MTYLVRLPYGRLDKQVFCVGAAFWEYSYIAGPPDTNQVLFNESTWTNIISPSADNALQTTLSSPAVAKCVPGNMFAGAFETELRLLFI